MQRITSRSNVLPQCAFLYEWDCAPSEECDDIDIQGSLSITLSLGTKDDVMLLRTNTSCMSAIERQQMNGGDNRYTEIYVSNRPSVQRMASWSRVLPQYGFLYKWDSAPSEEWW